jgi:riboflavin synthase alpha subunit
MSGYLIEGSIEATVAVLSVTEGSMARYCEVELPAHLRSSILPNRLVVLNGGTLLNLETNMMGRHRMRVLPQDGKSRDREHDDLCLTSSWFLGNEQRYCYPVH